MDDYLDSRAGYGLDDISISNMKIPFLLILQDGSPQVKSGPDKTEGAEAGFFYNNVTGKVYGPTIELVVLKFEQVWLEWKPRRGGLAGRHSPYSINVDVSDFSEWKLPNGNIINDTYSFVCLVVGHFDDGPVVFSLSKTGIKHAKNWNTLIRLQKLSSGNQCPIFGTVWKLETALNSNDSGSWFQIGVNSTNVTKQRIITGVEYTEAVDPAVKLLEDSKIDYTVLESSSSDIDKTEVPKDVTSGNKQDIPY